MMKRTAWFPFTGKSVRLPRNNKYYFDHLSTESGEITGEEKLLEIGYALKNGFKLRKELKDYIKHHGPIITDDVVKQSLVNLISEMRTGNTYDIANSHLFSLITLDEAIELFLAELNIRYRFYDDFDEVKHDIIYIYWDYDMIGNSPNSNQEKFNYIVTHATPVINTPTGLLPLTADGWEEYIRSI